MFPGQGKSPLVLCSRDCREDGARGQTAPASDADRVTSARKVLAPP